MRERLSPCSVDPFLINADESYRPFEHLRALEADKLRWFVSIQGNVTKVTVVGAKVSSPPTRLGSVIGPFSRKSRLRLLSYMNRIQWLSYPSPLFVTLTYPDTIVHRDYAVRTADRNKFIQSLERLLNRHAPCIWRVEWKPRKSGRFVGRLMPHWHLLFPTLDLLSEDTVRTLWRGSIGHDDTYLDVDSRIVVGVDAAIKYLAKYVSKQLALGIMPYLNSGFRFGRAWGVRRKSEIELCPHRVARYLCSDEVDCLREYAVSKMPYYDPRSGLGFTLFSRAVADEVDSFLE